MNIWMFAPVCVSTTTAIVDMTSELAHLYGVTTILAFLLRPQAAGSEKS